MVGKEERGGKQKVVGRGRRIAPWPMYKEGWIK